MPRIKATIDKIRVIFIAGICLIAGAACSSTATTSAPTAPPPATMPATEAQPAATATKVVPTPTQPPTETATPTAESEIRGLEIAVPAGSEAIIDGVLSPEEWEAAIQFELDDEYHLFLMHAGGYLYIGVRGKPEPVTSICLDQGKVVSILHSSAAIGTARYDLGQGYWDLVQDFEWCCRETDNSSKAQENLNRHLEEAGWTASNGLTGVQEEVEYQIVLPENPLRLVVNSIGQPDYRAVHSWPDSLVDDCSRLSMITGPIPEEAQFSIGGWATLSVSDD
jgi:hypothetical protein